MSVSADEFLAQSRRLLADGKEIDIRSSISRAYYSAYHCAEAAAGRMELPESARRNTGTHEKLFARFDGGGKRLKMLARMLRDKKRLRAAADYDLQESFESAEAVLHIREVESMIKELDRLGQSAIA